MGWAGQFADLEAVTFAAIKSPYIMNASEEAVVAAVNADQAYRDAFASAFPDALVSKQRIAAAVAAFERTLVSGTTPFDQWIEGNEGAMSETAKRGFVLFNGRAGCSGCHSGWNFTDGSFHDIGLAGDQDLGRGTSFPDSTSQQHAFKVPSLREIDRRTAFMHDGSLATLQDVIDLYDRGGVNRPSRSSAIQSLGLTAQEKAELLAFLHTLSSPLPAGE